MSKNIARLRNSPVVTRVTKMNSTKNSIGWSNEEAEPPSVDTQLQRHLFGGIHFVSGLSKHFPYYIYKATITFI